MDNEHSFHYTYSAQQQEEILSIRNKYLPKEENKMDQLRKLHYSATRKAQACSISVGVIGALILGSGMSLIMTDLGAMLDLSGAFPLGITVGLLGLILVALAYPIYNRVLKKERERISPEILRLSEELLK